jgi:hypothetical protein
MIPISHLYAYPTLKSAIEQGSQLVLIQTKQMKVDDSMRLALMYLSICSGSVLTVIHTKRRAEEAIPFTITAIIGILFLFYIVNKLLIGYYIILVIIIAIYLYAACIILYKGPIKKEKGSIRQYAKRLFTPGIAIFTVLFLVLDVITHDNLVGTWDELRLWAAYPKALYFTNQLQLGSDALIYNIMQAYPPGMALFQYFIQRLSGCFVEAKLFWAYGIFTVSVLLPALRNIQWKNILWIILITVCILIVPMLFSNSGLDGLSMYRSLYIDPMLGLLFAYCLFLSFQEGFSDLYATMRFALGLGALVLLKNTGVALGVMALVISAYLEKNHGRSLFKGKGSGRLRIRFVSAAICMFGFYLLWSITVKRYGVINIYPYNLKDFTFDPQYTLVYLTEFVSKSVLNTPMFGNDLGAFKSNILVAELICGVFASLVYLVYPKQERKAITRILLALLISNLLYFFGIYMTYLLIYHKAIVSFERYSCTVLQANITLIICCFLNEGVERIGAAFKRSHWVKVNVAVAAILIVTMFPINIRPIEMPTAVESAVHANIIKTTIQKNGRNSSRDKTSVYIAFAEDVFDIRHHRIYFDLLSDNIFIDLSSCGVAIIKIPISSDISAASERIAKAKQELMDVLATSHDMYLYFVVDVDAAKEQMPEFFSQGTSAGTMYKINYIDGEVSSFQKLDTDITALVPYLINDNSN